MYKMRSAGQSPITQTGWGKKDHDYPPYTDVGCGFLVVAFWLVRGLCA